jgi:hypothetical protein
MSSTNNDDAKTVREQLNLITRLAEENSGNGN